MRVIQTVVLTVISGALFSIAPASAEGLSGAEFKKIVIGNTLQRTSSSGKRRIYQFIDDKKMIYVSPDSNSNPEPLPTTWTVTDSGKFCWYYSLSDRNVCYSDFRVKGKKLIGKSRRGSELEFVLVKSKSKPAESATTAQAKRPAGALSGAEFKKLVKGNTLQLSFVSGSGREMDYRFYFIDEKTLYFTSARSSYPANEAWSISDEGRFCRVSARTNRKRCYRNFHVKGDLLISKSRNGRIREFKLLKGKHRYY